MISYKHLQLSSTIAVTCAAVALGAILALLGPGLEES